VTKQDFQLVWWAVKLVIFGVAVIVDEAVHRIGIDNNMIAYEFCQWSHKGRIDTLEWIAALNEEEKASIVGGEDDGQN
jgi:hypothetical protein